MPLDYENRAPLHEDSLVELGRWHHEGWGSMSPLAGGGMRLVCPGSRQGGPGCMAFFRPTLPDQVAIEYDIVVHSQGGLVINYVAIRGLNGEDLIEDAGKLEPRDGSMKNYFALKWGLQSYHLSFSRFDDKGLHTNTSNWRRNPGSLLAGHGNDPVREMGRTYHIRITKDAGFLQFYADGVFAHGVVDRDTSRHPIPDHGKFGFRLIGSDVQADIFNFRVFRLDPHPDLRKNAESTV
jgi:hypothetical protein